MLKGTQTVVLAGLLSLAAAGAASASALEPAKASEVVTLVTNGEDVNTGGCTGSSYPVTQRVTAAGLAGFSVPAGQVLVITGMSWVEYTATANTIAYNSLKVGGQTVLYSSSIAGSNNGANAIAAVSPGIVVASGQSICVGLSQDLNPSTATYLYGFLAKNK